MYSICSKVQKILVKQLYLLKDLIVLCENYAVVPSFFFHQILFIYARPPIPSTTLNCIIMPHDYYNNTWHVLMVKIPCIGYNS